MRVWCEELLFRGVVLGGFLRRYPATRAILASALLFAAIHLTIPQLLGAFVAGGYLGWWRARTGGLTAPVALHALYNAVALVVTKVWGLPAIYYTQTGLWISLANLAGGALLLFGIVRLSNRFLPALDLPRAADREEAS